MLYYGSVSTLHALGGWKNSRLCLAGARCPPIGPEYYEGTESPPARHRRDWLNVSSGLRVVTCEGRPPPERRMLSRPPLGLRGEPPRLLGPPVVALHEVHPGSAAGPAKVLALRRL